MPARDVYHKVVVQAMLADGWTITEDPLYLAYGGRDLYVDLGAERDTIGAEKDAQKIAVEIKSFLSLSPIRDLQEAVGQYDILSHCSFRIRTRMLTLSSNSLANL